MKLRTVVPLLALAILSTSVVATAPELAEKKPKPVITALGGDSVSMCWNSVQTPEQPIARYEHEMKKLAGDTLIVSGATTTFCTVAIIPAPPIGDSLVIYGRVRAVNTRGKAGPYGRSNNFTLRTTDPGPAAPTPTIRDTTAFITFDGVQANSFAMTVGQTVQACLYFIIDGVNIELAEPASQPDCPQPAGAQVLRLWDPFIPGVTPTLIRGEP